MYTDLFKMLAVFSLNLINGMEHNNQFHKNTELFQMQKYYCMPKKADGSIRCSDQSISLTIPFDYAIALASWIDSTNATFQSLPKELKINIFNFLELNRIKYIGWYNLQLDIIHYVGWYDKIEQLPHLLVDDIIITTLSPFTVIIKNSATCNNTCITNKDICNSCTDKNIALLRDKNIIPHLLTRTQAFPCTTHIDTKSHVSIAWQQKRSCNDMKQRPLWIGSGHPWSKLTYIMHNKKYDAKTPILQIDYIYGNEITIFYDHLPHETNILYTEKISFKDSIITCFLIKDDKEKIFLLVELIDESVYQCKHNGAVHDRIEPHPKNHRLLVFDIEKIKKQPNNKPLQIINLKINSNPTDKKSLGAGILYNVYAKENTICIQEKKSKKMYVYCVNKNDLCDYKIDTTVAESESTTLLYQDTNTTNKFKEESEQKEVEKKISYQPEGQPLKTEVSLKIQKPLIQKAKKIKIKEEIRSPSSPPFNIIVDSKPLLNNQDKIKTVTPKEPVQKNILLMFLKNLQTVFLKNKKTLFALLFCSTLITYCYTVS